MKQPRPGRFFYNFILISNAPIFTPLQRVTSVNSNFSQTLCVGGFWTASGACSLATPGGCTTANIANTVAGAGQLCQGAHQLAHVAANTETGKKCIDSSCQNPTAHSCVGACLGVGKEPEPQEQHEMSRPTSQQLQPTTPMQIPATGDSLHGVVAEASHLGSEALHDAESIHHAV
jgi:hypothetical protein